MKKIITLILLLISFRAISEEAPKRKEVQHMMPEHQCVQLGGMYRSIASFRDRGLTPEEALQFGQGYLEGTSNLGDAGPLQLPLKRIKEIINSVYFDPAFAGAGGAPLQHQIYEICMGTYKPIKPLK